MIKIKILCIDDNEEITQLMNKVLVAKGYEFSSTTSGREGLNLIRENNADLIFLDLAMPDFSGVDVIDGLIKDGTIHNYNIIIFTASSFTDTEIAKLIQKGAKKCVRKPVRLDNLLSVIKEFEK